MFTSSPSQFIFLLGREYRLSIAEILSVFPAAFFEFADEQVALVSNIPHEEIVACFPRLGGTIKIIEVLGTCADGVDFMDQSAAYLASLPAESKLSFAVASYREKLDNFAMGLRIKKLAKTQAPDKSFRLVNKDPKNINSAVYKKEKLSEFETEMNSIVIGETRYIGRTCAYQDVDLYAARDIGKERDMVVGMLPPKLAQLMVNLSSSQQSIKNGIYDPFVGLGTILIEAANMGYQKLTGSDLAPEMVRATEVNVADFIKQHALQIHTSVFRADAATLSDFITRDKLQDIAIVTEGYLGEIMTPRTVSDDRIASERRKLGRMYDGFFSHLKRLDFQGNVVISFPFWEIRGKYSYLEEGYTAFKRHGFEALPLLPENIEYKVTKSGSLLYKRPGQIVGREVLKLRLIR